MKAVSRWNLVFIIAGLVVLGGLVFWHWAAPVQSLRPYAGPVEHISISTSLNAKSALLFIAEHNGYFSENGLNVTLKIFPSGRLGLEQLKAGNIDIANASDFVLVSEVFAGTKSLRCLGSIAAADDHQVIARKDRGIQAPGDLGGKRIGVPQGTSAEFFLGRFLTFNNLGLGDVELISIQPAGLEDALATGEVDAVAVWQHWANEIEKRLGDKTISWPAQSGQKFYWLLMSKDDFAKARPEVLKRLFKALYQAEIFLKSHPEEGIEVIARRVDLDLAIVKEASRKSNYTLSFDQGLFIMMEDQARWMIKNKLTDQTGVPNYLNYMDAEALSQINPKAVGLIVPRKAAP